MHHLILPPLLFALSYAVLRSRYALQESWRTRNPADAGRRLRLIGAAYLFIAFACFAIGSLLVVATSSTARGSSIIELFPTGGIATDIFGIPASQNEGLAMSAVALYCMVVPALFLGVAFRLTGLRLQQGGPQDYGGTLAFLGVLGWLLFWLALMSFLPWFVALVALIPIVILLKGIRRARQSEKERQLISLLTVAIESRKPLPDEILAYADNQSGRYRRDLQQVEHLLRFGKSLPDALREVPGLLPLEVVDSLRIAASQQYSGDSVRRGALLQDARLLARQGRWENFLLFLNTIVGYLLVLGAVNFFLMYWIVPKYKAIFEGFGIQLPFSTVNLIWVSDLAVNFFEILALPFVVFMIGFVLLGILRIFGRGEKLIRWIRLKIRNTWVRLISPRDAVLPVLDHLALMTNLRVPLTTGVVALAYAPSLVGVRKRLMRVVHDAEGGDDVWNSLSRHRLITRSERDLLQSAEKVGNLPWALRLIADNLDRRSISRWEMATTMLRVATFLSLGLVVGFFALAFFEPLLTLLKGLA